MRVWVVSVAIALAACSGGSEFEEAQKRYEFLKANGASDGDLCAEAGRVLSASADDGNQSQYQSWKSTQDLHCIRDQLERMRREAAAN